MKRWELGLILGLGIVSMGAAQAAPSAGRRARDRGDVTGLQALVATATSHAAGARSAAAFTTVAQLDAWLCEAALDQGKAGVCTKAATDGAAAAKQAIALNPKSSDAYRLRGTLLGQLIANGGMMAGMRYGMEATNDLDTAIRLDPRSAPAYVARAISYFYTPDAFGGSKPKAIASLRKAIALAPGYDTPHIWMAQVLLATKQPAAALGEAQAAVKLDPDRVFARHVLQDAQKANHH